MKVSSLSIRPNDVNGISGLTRNDYDIPYISAVHLRNAIFPVHKFCCCGYQGVCINACCDNSYST